MEFRHLRYFVAVAEELSFSRAAKKLQISQPPLSQQIQDLEREIGFQLFDRSRRNIILTLAGKELLADARQILGNMARLERKIKLQAAGALGEVVIGVNSALVTPNYFAEMLRDFKRQNPGIKFRFVDEHSFLQLEALQKGDIDVGFLRPPSQLPAMLETHLIYREAMRIALPADHRLARKRKIQWGDLAEENFILIGEDIARTFYDEFYNECRNAGFEPKVKQYVRNLTTQLWLISAGMGLAPMPVTPGIGERSGVVYVPLATAAPVYETVMAWRRDDVSPVLQRFVEFVQKRR